MTKAERYRKQAETLRARAERDEAALRVDVIGKIKALSGVGASNYPAVGKALWPWEEVSVDAAYLNTISELRSKSRRLYNSSPIATGLIDTATTNVIGRGLRLQANIDREYLAARLGWTDDEFDAWEDETERQFEAYWNSTDCDYSRKLTGPGLERLLYSNVLVDGDCLAIFRGGVNDRSIQLIPAQNIGNPNRSANTETMREGVEIDPANGREQAYYVESVNRLNSMPVFTRVPAFGARTGRRLAILVSRRRYIGQSRGVPFIAPVMHIIRTLSDYMEAEKIRAKVSSLFAIFVRSRAADQSNPLAAAIEDLNEVNSSGQKKSVYNIEPGAVIPLDKDDEGIDFANPNAPNSNYAAFVDAGLREIGFGVQIPKSTFTKENSASYSAAKGDRMEAFRFFFTERAEIVAQFHRTVYQNFLTDRIFSGRINAPGFFEDEDIRNAFSVATWDGETPGQIDPTKDTQGAQLRNQGFYTTMTSEAAAVGQDFRRNVRRAKREKAMIEKAGLTVPAYLTGQAIAVPGGVTQ